MQTTVRFLLVLFCFASTTSFAAMSENEDVVWQSALKKHYFGEREIIEDSSVITLDAPKRAEDAALVPITIRAHIGQSEDHYIKKVTLLIDKNPNPMVGVFHLTPKGGLADMSMRVRVNTYTPMRAIAELNDGSLYMARKFVKASGGCSAPAAADMEKAMSRLGKIKMKARSIEGDNDLVQLKLNISHPNITGLQMDQVSRLYTPAHFVKQVVLRYDGEELLRAETDIAISENPSFRFHLLPQDGGELSVEVIDSKDKHFEKSISIRTPETSS